MPKFEFSDCEHFCNYIAKGLRESKSLILSEKQKSKLMYFFDFCEYHKLYDHYKLSYNLFHNSQIELNDIVINKKGINGDIFQFCLDNGNAGLYFFLDDKYNFAYIGKSKNLSNRVLASFNEKSNNCYHLAFMFMPLHCIHFLEPYYILKYKPYLNTDFKVDYEYDLPLIEHNYKLTNTFDLSIPSKNSVFTWGDFLDSFEV